MDVSLAFLTVLLLSPFSAVHAEAFDNLQAPLRATPSTGRRLKQDKNEVRITEGRYKGEFFHHDDIVISFVTGSQISDIFCALNKDPNNLTEIRPCQSPVSLTPYLELDGLYGFAVFGKDDVNKRVVNDTNLFIIDRTPPQTMLSTVQQQQDLIKFEFEGKDIWNASSFQCRLDSAAWESCSSPASYKASPKSDSMSDWNRDLSPVHHAWTVREDDLEVTALSNEVETAGGDGGTSKIGIIAVAVFVPFAVLTIVGIVIFLNRKKLASMLGKGKSGAMTRIP